jgi:hypothetical protein
MQGAIMRHLDELIIQVLMGIGFALTMAVFAMGAFF